MAVSAPLVIIGDHIKRARWSERENHFSIAEEIKVFFCMPMLRDLQFVRAENVNEFGYATLDLP